MNYKIDNLQYCKWSREVFQINRDAGLDAVHVTVVYHEDYDEFLERINEWSNHFKEIYFAYRITCHFNGFDQCLSFPYFFTFTIIYFHFIY